MTAPFAVGDLVQIDVDDGGPAMTIVEVFDDDPLHGAVACTCTWWERGEEHRLAIVTSMLRRFLHS